MAQVEPWIAARGAIGKVSAVGYDLRGEAQPGLFFRPHRAHTQPSIGVTPLTDPP
jgi:hypothetical protein